MEQITQEVIDLARKAVEVDKWEDFFDAFGFKIYGEVEDAEEIELESYTDGGGDMIISIDVSEDWKKAFKDYVEDFDIDNEVTIWWPDGKPGKGVPFDNIRDLYDDIEDWLDWLKDIVRVMEGKDPLEEEPSDCELDAIRKWVYWSYNFPEPAKFIKDIWGDGPFADHIMKKFIGYNANMNRFYCELDKENQRKLAEYVLKNYNPG